MSDATIPVAGSTWSLSRLSSQPLGAEARCGKLDTLDDAAIERIREAMREHPVLLIRDQSLSDEQLIAFGKRLGELDFAPLAYTGKQAERRHPEIIIVSNVKEGGVPIGVLGDGEVRWHSDNSYRETPLSWSLLYAVRVPESGGETGFISMYRAYETLSPELKARIQGLELKHDMTYNSAGQLRRGFEPTSDPVRAPGPCHPIVRTHPETGRKALYLGRRPNAYIVGLPLAQSEALLDTLWAHATQEEHAWYHHWRAGDVLIWDNRCVMHRRNPFDPSAQRILHRLQFKGERPYCV
jgi:alpha-ketoglutarate-dependent taurine dioxygenase